MAQPKQSNQHGPIDNDDAEAVAKELPHVTPQGRAGQSGSADPHKDEDKTNERAPSFTPQARTDNEPPRSE